MIVVFLLLIALPSQAASPPSVPLWGAHAARYDAIRAELAAVQIDCQHRLRAEQAKFGLLAAESCATLTGGYVLRYADERGNLLPAASCVLPSTTTTSTTTTTLP